MRISQVLPLFAIFALSAAQGKSASVPGKEGLPSSLLDDLLKIPSIMHPNDPINSEDAMASKGTGKLSPAVSPPFQIENSLIGVSTGLKMRRCQGTLSTDLGASRLVSRRQSFCGATAVAQELEISWRRF